MSTATVDDRGVVTACTACGQKNRVPYAHLGETGTCGSCKAALPPPGGAIEVDSEAHFDDLISTSRVPVVVDFWAPWCGPCKMVAPEMEKVAANAGGAFVVAKLNTDAVPSIGARYGISSIPTMAVFRSGREVTRTAGARPARDIEAFVRQAIR